MNKAVFLDRDGTINAERHYLYKIEDFEFLPGVIDGLKMLQEAGYLLIIITNQSGIARGYYTEDDFKILNDWMVDRLKTQGVKIDSVYYCPHLPDAKIEEYKTVCDCRKPALGLYEHAIRDYKIDLSRSWAVGDKIRDCSICEVTGCRGILVGNNEKAEIIGQVMHGKHISVQYAPDLYEAAKIIVEGDK